MHKNQVECHCNNNKSINSSELSLVFQVYSWRVLCVYRNRHLSSYFRVSTKEWKPTTRPTTSGCVTDSVCVCVCVCVCGVRKSFLHGLFLVAMRSIFKVDIKGTRFKGGGGDVA